MKQEINHSVYKRLQSMYNKMLSQCLKCRKNAESKNPKVARMNRRIIYLSKCTTCDRKKAKFIKQQKAG